ncbi:DNA primase [Sphingomonas sp. Leaf357]|uniref:CHC2 zinc finger domain-containing protein n=1 Tax=Sphingomonas sp. Leaf357 TaxID=1736350 RepID=UPI0006F2D8FA|nr:CHC2 zinc finger domain-containing protein [Sphingomonas sp. Leaf357]KQS04515.1 DNA primase [Sphingomonas sp. Leaf357]
MSNPFATYGASRTRRSIPRDDGAAFRQRVDDAKTQHNLSDIIRRHTHLKRRNPREMVGLCPFHQEKSPSFEVNDAKGTFYCHGCGVGGDHMTVLTKLDGLTFSEALAMLSGDQFPVVSEADRAKRKTADASAVAERVAIGRNIWSRSVPAIGTPAEVYARSRGIVMDLPDSVRFVMAPRWRNPETGEVGRDYPAMVCALQDVAGEVVGVQCVFLADGGRKKYERVRDDGTKAKAKLTFGTVVGSAFRASSMSSATPVEIIACEGPEDGLTLAQGLPGASVYVACGTALLPRLTFPSSVRSIVLAGDNNDAGRVAVTNAAEAFGAQGCTVRAMFPADGFKDWNDELRGIRA